VKKACGEFCMQALLPTTLTTYTLLPEACLPLRGSLAVLLCIAEKLLTLLLALPLRNSLLTRENTRCRRVERRPGPMRETGEMRVVCEAWPLAEAEKKGKYKINLRSA